MSGHTAVETPPASASTRSFSDQSFIRFGGLAGILLAVTSWSAVAEYFVLVPKEQQLPVADAGAYLASLAKDPTGTLLFNGLYALLALWALIGIVAVYYRVRAVGEAWTFFATLVGAIAAVGTILNGMYQLANLKFLATVNNPDVIKSATATFAAQPPTNPFGIMTFALTGLWFLVMAVLMLRTDLPKLLAYLGFVAVADLFFGFIVSLVGLNDLAAYAGVVAGAVGGPVFWLWLGILLLRRKA